jgi:hypothetical protein
METKESEIFKRKKALQLLPGLSKVKQSEWLPFCLWFIRSTGYADQNGGAIGDIGFNNAVNFVRFKRISFLCKVEVGATGFQIDRTLYHPRFDIVASPGVVPVGNQDFYLTGATAFSDRFTVNEGITDLDMTFDVSANIGNAAFAYAFYAYLGIAFAGNVFNHFVTIWGEYKI